MLTGKANYSLKEIIFSSQMIEYGTQVVGGVTPGNGGRRYGSRSCRRLTLKNKVKTRH
jgi:succinyl-CoA synthetase alpha subunit